MSAVELIRDIRAQGLCLDLLPDGALRVRGNRGTIEQWADTIRQHKPEIVAALRSSATCELTAIAEDAIRGWLDRIGETDADTIGEVLERCRQVGEVRDYFLHRALVGDLNTPKPMQLFRIALANERSACDDRQESRGA